MDDESCEAIVESLRCRCRLGIGAPWELRRDRQGPWRERCGVHTEAAVLHALNPTWAEESANIGSFFAPGRSPFDSWIVFVVVGVAVGGLLGAVSGGRAKWEIVRGPRASREVRVLLALTGGAVSGYAAQLARGCTSGQALTGGAQLALGSWVFMFAVFGSAYGLAYFVRRQWN